MVISKRYCAIWGGILNWAAKANKQQRPQLKALVFLFAPFKFVLAKEDHQKERFSRPY